MTIEITPAAIEDFSDIWHIFQKVVATGDTYIYPPDTHYEDARRIWMENTFPYIARIAGKIVGTFTIRSNKIGLGSHVCNAGFMVHPGHRRQGIGRMMGQRALVEAKNLGYHAMQFNVVVSTNTASIALWKSLGFIVIGTIPKGFCHQIYGMVDIHIMHRFL